MRRFAGIGEETQDSHRKQIIKIKSTSSFRPNIQALRQTKMTIIEEIQGKTRWSALC